ncbi:SHOCT domain-containing protein [Demequina capsici]|uniref:SHOCT domain-containing protein n=1 Tax=Demequina capsici TaxID=3075620 RepID=A0AA96FDI4_9MICO|nr:MULTISPECIES: SHOCT domain-containing protein [unclassified Demequina]WNM24679.1 SHOCT domain-containing protein [Demequina sp. OYTSA14]WNM27587.1 SHOCT domain-containing protein [Demequina sp. PMTSA13]
MDFLHNFVSILLFTLWIMVWVAFIFLVFRIIVDIFRDKDLGGFSKFLWALFVIVLPVLGALVYVIARGRSMSQRDLEAAQQVRAAQVEYTKGLVTEATGPAAEIKAAKDLLDAGTITAEEYEALKAKALA